MGDRHPIRRLQGGGSGNRRRQGREPAGQVLAAIGADALPDGQDAIPGDLRATALDRL